MRRMPRCVRKIRVRCGNLRINEEWNGQSRPTDRIVKTFLAILAPGDNQLGFHSFAHIVKGATTRNYYYNRVHKISRGLLISLSSATYLIGNTIRLASDPVINALCMSSAGRAGATGLVGYLLIGGVAKAAFGVVEAPE